MECTAIGYPNGRPLVDALENAYDKCYPFWETYWESFWEFHACIILGGDCPLDAECPLEKIQKDCVNARVYGYSDLLPPTTTTTTEDYGGSGGLGAVGVNMGRGNSEMTTRGSGAHQIPEWASASACVQDYENAKKTCDMKAADCQGKVPRLQGSQTAPMGPGLVTRP
jgi:hypothetical protein